MLTPRTLISAMGSWLVLATASGADLTLKGSIAVYPVVAPAAKAYQKAHPGSTITIGQGIEESGFDALVQGQINIAMATRALKPEEQDLVATPIGYDAVAILVHRSNPVAGLTAQQLAAIYTGAVATWKDVGGSDLPVAPGSLHEGTSLQILFANHLRVTGTSVGEGAEKVMAYSGGSGPGLRLRRLSSVAETIAYVALKPGAVGFCNLGQAAVAQEKGAAIKIISLDGIPAENATITSGAYSLRFALQLVTKGPPSGDAKRFIEFMTGSEGQTFVSANGAIPLE